MRDNRIETINKETSGFAIMMIGFGIWLSTWISAFLIYLLGNEGMMWLIFFGTGTALLGGGIYITGREERIQRYNDPNFS